MSKQKIAIIGSGISGLSAAYYLRNNYDVTLYEKNNYFGGHSNTVNIEYNNKQIAVDTGFIVFNDRTYPNLLNFFKDLDVNYHKSNMSFAVKVDDGRLEYAGTNIFSIFAQYKNIFNFNFIKMLRDILRFNKEAISMVEKNSHNKEYSLSSLIKDLKLGNYFTYNYLLPMSGAIWSCPIDKMLKYPASSFVNFFDNHGLLTLNNQPQWYSVINGSRQYVSKVIDKIGVKNTHLNTKISDVRITTAKKIAIRCNDQIEQFDKIILACHADQALEMISQPNARQIEILSSFKYQDNIAILHKDSSLMPIAKRAWASWVYNCNQKTSKNISVTYWMNNLQNIDKNYPLFVSLNPTQEINEKNIFGAFKYEHPIFDQKAINAQNEITNIQGLDNIYYCGAYCGNGFHEDGIKSALQIVDKIKNDDLDK